MSLVLLASLTCAIEPSAVACPQDRSGVERALRLQVEADDEWAAGRHAPAATRLGEVANAYPECSAYHRRRMNAALRAVEAWRAAFEASGDRSQVDAALTLVDAYLESLAAVYGAEVPLLDGYVRLLRARTELQALVPVVEVEPAPVVRPPVDPLDRAPVRLARAGAEEPWPARARDARVDLRRRNLLIAGGVTLGAGTGALIMLIAGAVRGHTLDCTGESSGPCGVTDDRREIAERVVVAGIVMTPSLIGAGVALVSVAHRRRPRAAVSLIPRIHPRHFGVGLEARF